MISEKKRKRPKTLQYVEDYLEDLLFMLETEEKPEVEVKVEEEKKETLKVRITSVTSNGERAEVASEVPHLSSSEILLLTPITVARPLGLIRPTLPLQLRVSATARLQPPYKIEYVLQAPVKVSSHKFRRYYSLHLPFVSSTFYSWLKDKVKQISFPRQPGVTAFVLKDLLKLIEILPRLPKVAERVEVNANIPTLESATFFMQNGVKSSLTEEAEKLRIRAQVQQLKGKGLLELLLPEEGEKLRRFRGTSGEYSGEPVLIILPEFEKKEHLWYLFWVACREFYREARGSYPEPAVLLSKGYDLWLKHPGSFSGKIVILRKQQMETNENKEWFKRRLQETFSQGLGYLIIMAGKDVGEAVDFVKELCKPYMPMIIDIQLVPKFSHILTILAKVLSEGFGIPYNEVCRIDNLKDRITIIIEENELQKFPQPDIMVARIDRAYRDFINELLLSNYIAYVKRDVSERESEYHVAMKILAIKYLCERFGIKPEKIACTYQVGDDVNRVIADIYVEEKSLAIECETELGTAPAPILKIFESVRKYIERGTSKPVNEVWVIVRNWSAVLHLGDLLWAESILKEELEKHGMKVKFFTADIHEKSLRPLSDIAKMIFSK
ncbi:MAG: hypothetical protein LZ163_02075 [Thaumarchaeota archaeon]|jgi:hypothetical protein|nr:hypothetical protein [Candidatus Terraquivivens yellowstonensis]